MTDANIWLFVIAIILIIIVPVINRFLPYKVKNCYWMWLVIGLGILGWFIGLRWSNDVKALVEMTNPTIYEHSLRWSKVLLLDLCPLSTVILSISLIADKTRSFAKVYAPLGFIGGFITLVGILVNLPPDFYSVSLVDYIFLGTKANPIYYLMHLVNCLLSIGIITASKTYTKYSVLGTLAFFLSWFAYMQICIQALNITNNATGMVEGDWYQPSNINGSWYSEYGFVYKLWPLPFPVITVVWYLIAVIVNFIIMFIWNRFCFSDELISKDEYWHQPWRKFSWLDKVDDWFDKVSYHIPDWLKNKRCRD